MFAMPFSVTWKWVVGFAVKWVATLPFIKRARIMLSSVEC